jgi:hypothetical protein
MILFIASEVYFQVPSKARPRFIRAEGFNTPPLGAVKTGIKPRVQPSYENNIPRPLAAGLLIVFFYGFLSFF